MLRSTIVLLAAALLATSAAAAPKHPPHKRAPKPAAPHAAAHGPSAQSAQIDTGDPAAMMDILEGAGAKAKSTPKPPDGVMVTVTSTLADFSVQFAQCDPQGRRCKAALFDFEAGGSPSLVQINGFNQASAMCRGYMDKSGKAHVLMSMLLFGDDTRQHLVTELGAWQGCIAEFSHFARDPVAYLANAP